MRSSTRPTAESAFNQKHFLYEAIKNKDKYKHGSESQHRREIIKHVNLLQQNKKCDLMKLQCSVTGLCFTQMHASKGIKLLGEKALAAMAKEYEQLDYSDVFQPEFKHELTTGQQKSALRAINLIKIKRSGKIKGRTMADRSKQRGFVTKEDSTSSA